MAAIALRRWNGLPSRQASFLEIFWQRYQKPIGSAAMMRYKNGSAATHLNPSRPKTL